MLELEIHVEKGTPLTVDVVMGVLTWNLLGGSGPLAAGRGKYTW